MGLIARLIDWYSILVFAEVVLSWVPSLRGNAIARFVEAATEPVLVRIRAVLPDLGGIDLSPLVLLFALQIVRRLIY